MWLWRHDETGAAISYAPGLTGDVVIALPVGLLEIDRPLVHRDVHDEIRLPGAVLAAFLRHLQEEEGERC